MHIRTLITSRWLLVLASLVLGGVIGSAVTLDAGWQYFRGVINRDWANKAATSSDIAAAIDAGQVPAARDDARAQLAIAADSMALNGADGPEFASYWRNIATYAAISPGIEFSPQAQALLGRYKPLTAPELDASHCVSGVCMLARRNQSTTRP